jgi:demethylmenaquinone methyltransferase/2-methoxy-6-polyprenyl-1,4-benzoquinol methylase
MSKDHFIKEVFSSVADKYDLMNDLMSLGIHRVWKNKFCNLIENLDSRILDVASGSGDIAFRLYHRALKNNITPRITLADVNDKMLQIAKDRAINSNILNDLEFIVADATNLPFENNYFDYYTIAFGIRNICDINAALVEGYRVLKSRGHFLCLEFSKPTMPLMRDIYNLYLDKIIPKIGHFVTNHQEAYQYLASSIKAFPEQSTFLGMMQKAGFKISYFKNLSGGIACIYFGYKL